MGQIRAWNNQSDEKCFLQGENFTLYFSNCLLHASPQTFVSPTRLKAYVPPSYHLFSEEHSFIL